MTAPESSAVSPPAAPATWTNWSGRLTCSPQTFCYPESEEELCETVRSARTAVRVAGAGHSFTALVLTENTLISLDKLSGLIEADVESRRATIWAGTRISHLGVPLADAGLALANQGDIDKQTMAGAVATGTHGTGVTLGCIASRVSGLRMVTAAGEVIRASAKEEPDLFLAGRVSLGALGVFSQFELDTEPRYNLRERVWAEPVGEILGRTEALCGAHRHFEFFAFPFTGMALCKTLDLEPYEAPDRPAHEAADSSDAQFAQLLELNMEDPPRARESLRRGQSKMRPSEQCAPSHQIFPSERTNLFNEMEYAVPADSGLECLQEVLEALESADLPVLFPIEFRYVAADDLWLSPFYQRASAVLAVHQYARQDFRPVFACAEAILRKHGGRPHWGKIHTLGLAELAELYPRWNDFLELRERLDPNGKFLNPYLRRLFGIGES